MNQKTQKILVVDDEQDVRFLLKFNLEIEGYEVDTAPSGEVGLVMLAKKEYSLAILDIMMDGMSGFELAQIIRSKANTSNIGIIFITALDGEDNVIKGLNIGGDDYISKTLSIREIKARVKAVLRRNGNFEGNKTVGEFSGLKLDYESKRAFLEGKEISLTKLEFELLSLLCQNEGKLYSRESIMKLVWPDDSYVLERTVDVTVTRLRHKLGKLGSQIKTRVGYGYYFESL